MRLNIKHSVSLIILLQVLSLHVFAQPESNWDKEKLIGQRYLREMQLDGSAFIIDEWNYATVTLKSGEKLEQIAVKYNGYEDQLISYNESFFTLLQVEKETVESFEFEYVGNDYYFELRDFGGSKQDDKRFFQVYHEGLADLLCFRRINIIGCSPYFDTNGVYRNQRYETNFRYFLYTDEGGYNPVSLNRKSLLRYVTKDQRKEAKRLIRQNNINLKTPEGLARAISILEENQVGFNL